MVGDLQALDDVPLEGLLMPTPFGSIRHARQLCRSIEEAGINKHFLIDVRADTVVRHPELLEEWKKMAYVPLSSALKRLAINA